MLIALWQAVTLRGEGPLGYVSILLMWLVFSGLPIEEEIVQVEILKCYCKY